jgi:hypothetical protein
MKKLLLLVAVVVFGLLAFNYFTTGELRLLPASSSPQAQELDRLQSDLRAAVRSYRSAAQAAGVSGVDFTAEATATRREASTIEKRVLELQKQCTTDKDREKAQRLLEEVRGVLSELR